MLCDAALTPPLLSPVGRWASQLDWTAAQWEEDLGYMKQLGIGWAFVTYTSCQDGSAYTAYCWTGAQARRVLVLGSWVGARRQLRHSLSPTRVLHGFVGKRRTCSG